MTIYRRKKDSDTWHWCRNCSNWPTSDYEEVTAKPTSGELDNECKAKEKAKNCSEQYSETLPNNVFMGEQGSPVNTYKFSKP